MRRVEFWLPMLDLRDWLQLFFQAKTVNVLYQLRSATSNTSVYEIWWARNMARFQHKQETVNRCSEKAILMLQWRWS